jgi:hypothetical protein
VNADRVQRNKSSAMTACLDIVLIALLSLTANCTTASPQPAAVKTERMSKIGPELIALYHEYSAYLASPRTRPFQPSSPLVRFIDGRVVIDAVASGDVDALRSDLVSLGMQGAAAFGRIVSGQLPVSAIPKLAALTSLKFANAAAGLTQSSGGFPSH